MPSVGNLLPVLLKVVTLFTGTDAEPRVPAPVNRQEHKESLRVVIEEQKRDYDYLKSIYDRTRATESILLTAAFGIIAYLYYTAPLGSKSSIAERLFIPTEDYGKVIYFIAAGFFAYGLFKLMLTVFGHNPWMTAYESTKTDYSHDELETLQYVKGRYDICHAFNHDKYKKRKKQLIFLFYTILISAIILIVIKTLK